MKITCTILTLLAAGLLGRTALGSDTNGPLAFAVIQDGHGGSHMMYYQTYDQQGTTTVALSTNSGGVMNTAPVQGPPLADNGQTRFVIGTNQHAQANSAYIPVSSHFGPASQ